jgi:hypothetical protein
VVDFTDSRRCLSYAQARWAHDKWCQGYTLRQIGEALFVHPRTLQREFAQRGWRRIRPKLVYIAGGDGLDGSGK